MKIKRLVELKCKRCGHPWLPRKIDVRVCPKCHSALWDVGKDEVFADQDKTEE